MTCEVTTNSGEMMKNLENDKIGLHSEISQLKQELRTSIFNLAQERYDHKLTQNQANNYLEELNKWKHTIVKDLEPKLHKEYDQLKSAKDVLQTENNQLKADKSLALQNVQNLQEQLHKCQAKNIDFNDKNKELAAKLLKSESSQILLNNKIFDLENDLITQTKFFEEEKLKFVNTVNSLQEQIESFKHIPLQNDHLKSANKALHTKIQDLNDKLLQNQSNELILKKKISDLESDLQIQTKFFKDEKLKLNDALESLESASESLQKENNGLRASYDILTQKLDTRSQPKAPVSVKIHTGESFKPILKKVSQFTTYSLQKDRKYFKKPHSTEMVISPSFLSFENNSSFISNAITQMKNRERKLHSKVSSCSTHTKSFKYSFTKLFELAPRPVCRVESQKNDFVLKNPTNFKTPSSFKPSWKSKDFQSPLLP